MTTERDGPEPTDLPGPKATPERSGRSTAPGRTSPPAADVAPALSDEVALTALIAEAARRSSLVWVSVDGAPARPVWHVWHGGCVYVVHGGDEQPLPGIGTADTALVTVRSKDKGGRLVTFVGRVEHLAVGSKHWHDAAEVLRAARLNAVDAQGLVDRWATGSAIVRLVPTGEVPEHPGRMPDGSHAAAPAPTPATTAPPLPFVLGAARRRRARRRSGR